MKRVLALAALALVASGCTTQHQPEPATDGATSTTPTPTTVASTEEARLPALEPHLTVRSDVPWQEVGPDWHLVMTLAGPHLRQPDHREADEARLQLLSPSGVRTDIVVMDHDVVAESGASKRAWPFPSVEDFSPEDRTVLLLFHDASRDATAVLLDLVTGEQRQARVPSGTAALTFTDDGFAYLDVRQRLVVAGWDGSTEQIARPVMGALPLADRSGVVVPAPLRVVGFDGSTTPLSEPAGEDRCRPSSWWTADTVVLTCAGGTLWTVPLDGAEPHALVEAHDGEYGIDEAVRLDGETYVQKLEGCGGGWLARANPDGSTTDLDRTREWRLVDAAEDRLVVRPATTCGEPGPHVALALLDPHTLEVDPLLTLAPDEVLWSVRSWGELPRAVA